MDGIRALAVLAVLCYHANYSWALGGFLGNDRDFFRLDGYALFPFGRTSTIVIWPRYSRGWISGRFDSGDFMGSLESICCVQQVETGSNRLGRIGRITEPLYLS